MRERLWVCPLPQNTILEGTLFNRNLILHISFNLVAL